MGITTRVLIVDDHILFREGLQTLLELEPDFRVVGQASNVQEAIEMAKALKPDLVLMDINLPDGSGLDAVETISLQSTDTAVVILTVHEPNEYLLDAIRAGAKGFIPKGTHFAKLVAGLRAVRNGETAISRMMVNRLVDEVRRLGKPPELEPDSLVTLTPREVQILSYMGRGASNREIASMLVISENTVRVHVHNLLEKLGLKSRVEAATFAKRYGVSAPRSHSGL